MPVASATRNPPTTSRKAFSPELFLQSCIPAAPPHLPLTATAQLIRRRPRIFPLNSHQSCWH
jgi:hypothetical protein